MLIRQCDVLQLVWPNHVSLLSEEAPLGGWIPIWSRVAKRFLNGLTTKGNTLTGNHRFSHEIWDFPVIFHLNQSIDFRFFSQFFLVVFLRWRVVSILRKQWSQHVVRIRSKSWRFSICRDCLNKHKQKSFHKTYLCMCKKVTWEILRVQRNIGWNRVEFFLVQRLQFGRKRIEWTAARRRPSKTFASWRCPTDAPIDAATFEVTSEAEVANPKFLHSSQICLFLMFSLDRIHKTWPLRRMS